MLSIDKLIFQEDGQGMVEYALIIGLVAVMLVAALNALKDGLVASIGNSANQIP